MQENTPLLPRAPPEAAVPKPRKNAASKNKLGTFEGVFLPTSLNVLLILMFLRFGFIIGQMGILGTVLLLVMSYVIDTLTVLSLSAISTNGTVKGGGAYYMISRSLGPEFGGAIGLIFFIGQILNSSLNVVGFIEPLLVNFGQAEGDIVLALPESYWWTVLYSTILLALCTAVAMVGPSLVSRTAFWLFIVLTVSTLSIPVSAIFASPGYPLPPPYQDLRYTGICWSTIKGNFWPQFTSGAAGSVMPQGQPETFKNLFGVFFPATAGIFAGASMSGELKNPSQSIPQGTLKGLLASFFLYLLVILSLGSSTPRALLHKDIKIIQTVNLSSLVIVCGEVSTSLFSVIMGVVGAASLLNAIADDMVFPGLSWLAMAKKLPRDKRKAEILAIIVAWALAQVFLFADINQIATFITMAFLMTFLVMNMACFLLRLGSAPNFRPSFKYFSSKTALSGCICSAAAMYLVDGVSATSIIVFLMFLVLLIHYSTPPLKFGDISQLLIYHQVRKYLLRLKLQMSVKYWRPQILLLCDDPRTSWNLIGFCNHLKKGGLYILGHVVIIPESSGAQEKLEFGVDSFKEVLKQKNAWVKLRDMAKIKAFVQIAIGPSLPWGVRNVFLGSGLGGMKPNITVLGFYDFDKHHVKRPRLLIEQDKDVKLPTDDCRHEQKVSINQWVQIVEDLIIMQATVGVAANMGELELPKLKGPSWRKRGIAKDCKKFIDLYPIQMSSICLLEDGKPVLSTNFDTYTLILQLGSILQTVDEWHLNDYKLRIIVFVESETEREEESLRLTTLLESLRIDAILKVVCLDDGTLESYNFLIKGYSVTPANEAKFKKLTSCIAEERWWCNIVEARQAVKENSRLKQKKRNSSKAIAMDEEKYDPVNLTARSPATTQAFGKSIGGNRRYTLSNLHEQGLSLSFSVNRQGWDNICADGTTINDGSDSETESEFTTSLELSSHLALPTRKDPSISTRDSSAVSLPKQASAVKSAQSQFRSKYLSSRNISTDRLSVHSSRSNLRPNFSAVKIPKAQVQSEDDEEDCETAKNAQNGEDDDKDEENKPGIKFVEEGPSPEKDVPGGNGLGSKTPSKGDNATKSKPLSILNSESIQGNLNTDSEEEEDEEEDEAASEVQEEDSRGRPKEADEPEGQGQKVSLRQLEKELANLTFSDLPAKGQHLILNEFMRLHSPIEDTAVIFSTLPPPVIGTHLDDESSLSYTTDLAIWLDNLPPTLLVNSQTVTVTTSL